MLEIEYDRRAEADAAPADDIAARFEEFLRDQRDDPPDPRRILTQAAILSERGAESAPGAAGPGRSLARRRSG